MGEGRGHPLGYRSQKRPDFGNLFYSINRTGTLPHLGADELCDVSVRSRHCQCCCGSDCSQHLVLAAGGEGTGHAPLGLGEGILCRGGGGKGHWPHTPGPW